MTSPTSALPAPSDASPVERTRTQRKLGRLFVVANLAAAIAYAGFVLATHGFDVDSLLDCIGALTPIGMLYFLAAFTVRPLDDLLHTSVTRWAVANRRYLGLSFASWHLMHWPILLTVLAMIGPSEFWDGFSDFLIPGGSILVVITLMAATSTDGAQRWLGMRLWSALHTIGLYAIWAWAFHVYLGRLPDDATTHDYIYLWLFVGALALRWIAVGKRLLTRSS